MTKDLIPPIADSAVDVNSPVSAALATALRNRGDLTHAALEGDSTVLLEGAIDSVSSGTITDANPTSGAIDRTGKFNEYYLRLTSGTIFANDNFNRFKITGTNDSLDQIIVAEDLVSLGAVATDTYKVIGHVHDGETGSLIDLTNLRNHAEQTAVTQDVADALTDPDNNRPDTADKANPFITVDGVKETAAIRDYTEAGRSQSLSLGSGSGNVSHTLANMPAGDNIVFGFYKIKIVGPVGNDLVGFDAPVTGTDTYSILCGIAGFTLGSNGSAGTFSAKAQNGDSIRARIDLNGGGTSADVEFEIYAYQPVQ